MSKIRILRNFVLPALFFFMVSSQTFAAKITNTEQLVAALQKKYAKSW